MFIHGFVELELRARFGNREKAFQRSESSLPLGDHVRSLLSHHHHCPTSTALPVPLTREEIVNPSLALLKNHSAIFTMR